MAANQSGDDTQDHLELCPVEATSVSVSGCIDLMSSGTGVEIRKAGKTASRKRCLFVRQRRRVVQSNSLPNVVLTLSGTKIAREA